MVEAELTGQQIAAAVALASVQPTPSKTLHRFLERTAVKTKKTKKTREKPNSTQVQRTEAEARSKSRVLAVEQYYDKEESISEELGRELVALKLFCIILPRFCRCGLFCLYLLMRCACFEQIGHGKRQFVAASSPPADF